MSYLQETNDADYLSWQGTAQYSLIPTYSLKILIQDNLNTLQRKVKEEKKRTNITSKTQESQISWDLHF